MINKCSLGVHNWRFLGYQPEVTIKNRTGDAGIYKCQECKKTKAEFVN
jgi:hypothetical protein